MKTSSYQGDFALLGGNKGLLGQVAEAAVLGAFASKAMSLPQAAGALARAGESPDKAFGRALEADVADTNFKQGPVDEFARRAATDPNLYNRTLRDTVRGGQTPSETVAPAVQTPSETAAQGGDAHDTPPFDESDSSDGDQFGFMKVIPPRGMRPA